MGSHKYNMGIEGNCSFRSYNNINSNVNLNNEALATNGQLDKSAKIIENLLKYTNHLGLFSKMQMRMVVSGEISPNPIVMLDWLMLYIDLQKKLTNLSFCNLFNVNH